MADYTTITTNYNSGAGTDAAPVWTGTSLAFGGSAGANELRWCASGAGAAGTASAAWPLYSRPGSTGVIPEVWAFTADTTGLKVQTYDGTSAHYMQFRFNFDALGTLAAAFQFTAFGDNTHATPSAGTQPGAQSGSPIVNGHATDTSSTSYLKANAYGYGVDTGGTQQTPAANAAGTLAVTTGTSGAVSPGTGAWLATWQSMQGFTSGQYILDAVICKALTAGFWYFVLSMWSGPNMSTGTLQPVLTLQYSYS
jgi:hypothetical protein